MDHSQLADLLAQTMPQKASNASGNRVTPLSPRQAFQSHVRTLNSRPTTTKPSPAALRSPELQQFSSLQVNSTSPPPRSAARPIAVYGYNDIDLRISRDGQPEFVAEEREAWARPSPLRIRKRPSNDVYVLQPPEPETPVKQPSKETRGLQQFGPMPATADTNERPKTSRGPDIEQGSFDDRYHEEDQNLQSRNSKFAEGSMSNRSAGISSTWHKHGSISSLSDVSDHELTPRASPQRSSVDVDEFKPPAVTPSTLKQRLFKIGSTFKPNERAGKIEDPLPREKKKKGLRKSISMWNLSHLGDKKKAREADLDHDPAPQTATSTVPAPGDKNVLNERKRRAEEAYVQQFGSKRRKSTGAQIPLPELAIPPRPLPVPELPTKAPRGPRRKPSVSSSAIATDSELSDDTSCIDHHKRPTRRELEKENQHLRAMLKQQHVRRKSDGAGVNAPVPACISLDELANDDETPKMRSAITSGSKEKPPPVPPVPDRVALRNLSNVRNQPKNKTSSANSTSSIAISNDKTKTREQDNIERRPLTDTNTMGLPRPFSIIFEEDEEAIENKTPTPSPKRRVLEPSSVEKRKVRDQISMQMKGVRREQWEWPEDVF
ncbi:hypothetical protein H2204_005345 [Knufia peltigerae]|uniref:Uncharacterized protein n=1 Tax=Knufia peltigerae TaxID=1002370 RepID=A0AA38Y5R4_9EURO|nr:hypothetical protein H2204_005345 [Knufia peltigerae]